MAWRLLGIEPLELLNAFRKIEFVDESLVEDEPNFDEMEEVEYIGDEEADAIDHDEDPDALSIIATEDADGDYGWGLSKVGDEMRYTFAVVCKASGKDRATDSHNEFPSADELRKAQWGYLRSGDRNIYLSQQHDFPRHAQGGRVGGPHLLAERRRDRAVGAGHRGWPSRRCRSGRQSFPPSPSGWASCGRSGRGIS